MATTTFSFEAIGTHWQIEVFEALDKAVAAELQAAILTRIEAYDKAYSRFREDSLVTEMSRKAGKYQLPADARPLLDIYQQLYRLTAGAVTPLIGNALSAAGYDAAYTLKPTADSVTAPASWDEAITYDPGTKPGETSQSDSDSQPATLTIHQPVLLDFGAAGKGYLADIIAELLQSHGIHSFIVDAGGDIVYQSTDHHSVNIGLEHPADPEMVIGVAHLTGGSLCGSAGNRRTWPDGAGGSYHHILDPNSLQSPRHIAALWVTANSGLIADALATALFFVSPAVLQKDFAFEYALVRSDMTLAHSENFPADFFVKQVNEKIDA